MASVRHLAALSPLLLAACAPSWPRGDWSADAAGHLHKTEFLRFLAPADCATPPLFSPVAFDATFSQVIELRPVAGRPWTYDLTYIAADGARRQRYDVVQWWTPRGTRYAPSATQQTNCVVMIDVPRSKNEARPYYLENREAKTADYDVLNRGFAIIFLLLCVVWGIGTVLSTFGFEDSRDMPGWHKSLIALVAGALATGISIAAGQMCISAPWRAFETALKYYQFFDELPRSGGSLLPLSSHEFYFLLAGPPSPNDTKFAFDTYACITCIVFAAWLIGMLPAIVRGLYWVATPLPLEQLHHQALAEGRRPTPEEILSAVHAALAGKAPWQLRIMQRKADLFAQRFGYRFEQ